MAREWFCLSMELWEPSPLRRSPILISTLFPTSCRHANRSLRKPPKPARRNRRREKAGVLNGIDVLERDHFAQLKGLRIGLITNHTGTNRRRYPTIHLLMNAPDVKLAALFSPEHGLYRTADESVTDGIDETTGLPVYSLYGKHLAPTPDQLEGLDALVFAIQDNGCRCYTYTSTLGLAMEAAAAAGVKFFVLDRVNVINGDTVDGPMLTDKTSFVAYHPIPVRYGMTLGELAQMYNDERHFGADLTVIKLEGWKRGEWFDETALPWRNFSPNMRSETEAALYPGVGLLERTSVSVGRGTGTPWELVGAPYMDDRRLAAELNAADLPGVRFLPVRFTPSDSVFKGQSCAGVNLIITDRAQCNTMDVGILLGNTLNRLYPEEFNVDKMDVLMGNQATLNAIKADAPLAEIRQLWTADLEKFKSPPGEIFVVLSAFVCRGRQRISLSTQKFAQRGPLAPQRDGVGRELERRGNL